MTINPFLKNTHRPLLAGLAGAGLMAGSVLIDPGDLSPFVAVSTVQAADGGHSGGHSGGGRSSGGGHDTGTTHTDDHTDDHAESDHGKKGPGGNAGSGGKGGGHAGSGSQYLVDSVFRAKGRGGLDVMRGPSVQGGAGKGDLYGDLYVILRNPDGSPRLDDFDRVQFLDTEGNVISYVSNDPDSEGFTEVVNEAALQEVEFERLNVGRAPPSVLDHAFEEALRTLMLDADGELQTDAAGRLVVVDAEGNEFTIDSPLANLSLYRAALNEGVWTLQDAAVFLGGASSKTSEITADTVVYLNTILGINNPADGYYDLSGFAYDRSEIHTGSVTYLTDPEGNGSYVERTESVMDAVFGGTGYAGAGVDAFAQAADDARAVIEFVHEPIH